MHRTAVDIVILFLITVLSFHECIHYVTPFIKSLKELYFASGVPISSVRSILLLPLRRILFRFMIIAPFHFMQQKQYLRKVIRATILTALVCLLLFMLSGCGQREDSLSVGYLIEENQQENKATYPYVVHTESSTWYLAKDDIALLGEEDYYAGLTEILEDMEQDFADARAALAGYLQEEIPPVDIFTDFCGKAGISENGRSLLQRNDFISFLVL
jgi:hypothetical protein